MGLSETFDLQIHWSQVRLHGSKEERVCAVLRELCSLCFHRSKQGNKEWIIILV